MENIKNFKDFNKSINEGDGFGTLPFLQRKDGDLFYYLFQLEMGSGETKGFMFVIGKYSQYETVEGAKNSYAVLNVNEISPEFLEDIAINKTEFPEVNDDKFSLKDNDLRRFFEQIAKSIMNYLEKNPKVVRIFDEMGDNCDIDNYPEIAKSIILSFLGSDWSMQEGSEEGALIFSR